jgi:curved DNA-binding protein CbpA
MDYYSLLGVSKNASAVEIRKAYALLARERHPDRFPDPDERAQAHTFFQEATAAFNTLSNPRTRQEYDASLERPQTAVPEEIARDAFERGCQEFDQKRYHEAVELLRTAVQHMPNEARYHAALGRTLCRNPHWVREGIQEVERAIALAPQSPHFHVELAELLLAQGLRLRARKAAETAMRYAPEDARALKILDQTAPDPPDDEPPPESGGGLRGLLRRRG